MATARTRFGGVGTQTLALAFGGSPYGTSVAATEEWTGAGPATKTITVS
jgi:hypothetical protein